LIHYLQPTEARDDFFGTSTPNPRVSRSAAPTPDPFVSYSAAPIDDLGFDDLGFDLDQSQPSPLARSSAATSTTNSANSCAANVTRTPEADALNFPRLQPPSRRMQNAHRLPCIQLVLLVLAYLNTKYGVSHRACDFLLRCLRIIFIMIGIITSEDDFPIKLQTVQHRLQLTDRFQILVTCPECQKIYPKGVTYESQRNCSACNGPLWDVSTISRYTTLLGRRPPPPTPKLTTPYRPLKDAFHDMFTAHPELVDLCMLWQDTPSEAGVYERVMDGLIWQGLRHKDGTPFFDRSERSVLRIGIFINMDW
jgi:hypothetical protein